jgi:hypothetical protein
LIWWIIRRLAILILGSAAGRVEGVLAWTLPQSMNWLFQSKEGSKGELDLGVILNLGCRFGVVGVPQPNLSLR